MSFFKTRIETKAFKDYKIDQTIFWQPQIIPDENGKANISLPDNIDLKGKVIIIEGINNKGKITYSKFEVD